jgi:hypothetical protein
MKRVDQVMKNWHMNAFYRNSGNQGSAKFVKRERDDSTLDKVFGYTPEQFYTGKIVRRRATAVAA